MTREIKSEKRGKNKMGRRDPRKPTKYRINKGFNAQLRRGYYSGLYYPSRTQRYRHREPEQRIGTAQRKTEQAIKKKELANEDTLYQIDYENEQLEEQVNEKLELLDVKEENEVIEPVQIETPADQKPLEQPVEISEHPLVNEIAHARMQLEQLKDLESLLDQIELVEPEEEIEAVRKESEPVE